MKTPLQRKQESILKLQAQSIPYIEWLPHIESVDEVIARSVESIAKRAIACLIIIQVACDLNNQQFDQETKDFIVDLLNKFEVFEIRWLYFFITDLLNLYEGNRFTLD